MNKFEFTLPKNAGKTSEELILDLKSVAKQLNLEKLSQPIYTKYGKYDCSTISRRFGTWNNALLIAGLKLSNISKYPDEELFENILNIWQHKGMQPTRRDMNISISKISSGPYTRRFSSWQSAILDFINYANENELDVAINDSDVEISCSKTSRDPSLRLRYNVLKRDNFSCIQCGASPAKNPNVELHIDHIIPWSRNGVTEFNNLQTLCKNCNLGKSNLI